LTTTAELVDTNEKNAQAKEDIEDTKKSWSVGEEFLMMLKEKCSMPDEESEERQKTRQLEMEAVSRAWAVLSGDDAHDLFTRTFNPALLQVDLQDSRRAQAAKLLSDVAKRLQTPKLSNLAYRVRLDAFTRVKKAIDVMVAQLLKEKEDEIENKDFCVDEFNTNQLQTEKKEREKKDLMTKIEDLEMTIKTLTEAIDTYFCLLLMQLTFCSVHDTCGCLLFITPGVWAVSSMTDKEWEERQKTRQLEIEAVSKALAVFSGDDAHDLFTCTFNPALLQVDRQNARRARASKFLSDVAKRFQNPTLSKVAYRVRLDAFTRVKKAIDDMVAQLLKEIEDEIKHKDFCVDEFNKNQLQTEKKDLIAKIEDLEMTIKTLIEAIEKLKGEIAEMQVQMKRAGEDREKESKEFQTTVADQREI